MKIRLKAQSSMDAARQAGSPDPVDWLIPPFGMKPRRMGHPDVFDYWADVAKCKNLAANLLVRNLKNLLIIWPERR
jgi:hypothetical protein